MVKLKFKVGRINWKSLLIPMDLSKLKKSYVQERLKKVIIQVSVNNHPIERAVALKHVAV